jgi:hypothetical protein
LDGRKYKNALDCTMQTVRSEGIRGLYRGLSASYLGVTESTLQWVLYEKMKSYIAVREERIVLSGRQRTTWDEAFSWSLKLGAAGSAKFVAALITYPHEVVRTRLRQAPVTTSVDGVPQLKYTGLAQCFKLVWKEEGMAALYGGLVPQACNQRFVEYACREGAGGCVQKKESIGDLAQILGCSASMVSSSSFCTCNNSVGRIYERGQLCNKRASQRWAAKNLTTPS